MVKIIVSHMTSKRQLVYVYQANAISLKRQRNFLNIGKCTNIEFPFPNDETSPILFILSTPSASPYCRGIPAFSLTLSPIFMSSIVRMCLVLSSLSSWTVRLPIKASISFDFPDYFRKRVC
jgi:hypothetical protein